MTPVNFLGKSCHAANGHARSLQVLLEPQFNSIQRQRQDTIAEKFNSRPVAPTLKLNGLSHDFAAIGLSFAPGVSVGPAVLPTKFKLRADF